MSGAKTPLPSITEAQAYDKCWLELDLPVIGTVALERAMKGEILVCTSVPWIYRFLGGAKDQAQFVIIENDPPPIALGEGSIVTSFAGSQGTGERRGLY